MIDWKVRTYDLVLGLISVFIAVALILMQYSIVTGMRHAGEGDLVLKNVEGLFFWWGLVLFFSLMGGFEIGRYVQAQFTKGET